jgi:GTP-binding protein HflX
MEENKVLPERAVLVGIDTGEYDVKASIDELTELAKTAGAEVAAILTQVRKTPDSALYIGKGKVLELKEFCANNEIDIIIFDDELSPIQQRNIENETDIRVIDRTTLILDIFARRAKSGEGKLQVELAQLKYMLPRLTGKGTALSRLGGGIGTRGPGETKLESDRRHIRRRINTLKNDLILLEKRRQRQRKRREKDGVLTVALVGYTNAGKSTLMNALTDAGVFVEDKLFATLDPTARALRLLNGETVILIDTVGFIQRLPHKLIEAFKSTLDEAVNADVILNVCDASSDDCKKQLSVTNDLLKELGCSNIPTIPVFNKWDLVKPEDTPFIDNSGVSISALKQEGLELLLEKITDALPKTRHRTKLLIPFTDISEAAKLRESGTVHSEKYTDKGIILDITAEIALLQQVKDYFY